MGAARVGLAFAVLSLLQAPPAWCGSGLCEAAFVLAPALRRADPGRTLVPSSAGSRSRHTLGLLGMSIKDPKSIDFDAVRAAAPTGCVDADFAHVPARPCTVPLIEGPLRNRYFALRHGQSEANVADVISSLPARGTTIHGLTDEGRRQARASAPDLLEAIGKEKLHTVVMCSSNFTRARQTAEEAAGALRELVAGLGDEVDQAAVAAGLEVRVIEGLRERWFGELDNTIITNYNLVWPADLKDAKCVQYGVESVDACCERLRAIILQLEEEHEGRSIVLTSHADTLQILQSYLAHVDPRTFSQFRFKNGEIRALLQDPSSMPAPVPLTYK